MGLIVYNYVIIEILIIFIYRIIIAIYQSFQWPPLIETRPPERSREEIYNHIEKIITKIITQTEIISYKFNNYERYFYLPRRYYQLIFKKNPTMNEVIEAMSILDDYSSIISSNQYLNYSNHLKDVYDKIKI
jgi:hypothetical protein